jgi:hypothetical protein
MNKVSQLTAIISESVQGRVSPPPKRLPILSRKDAAIAPDTKPQLEHQNASKKKKRQRKKYAAKAKEEDKIRERKRSRTIPEIESCTR